MPPPMMAIAPERPARVTKLLAIRASGKWLMARFTCKSSRAQELWQEDIPTHIAAANENWPRIHLF